VYRNTNAGVEPTDKKVKINLVLRFNVLLIWGFPFNYVFWQKTIFFKTLSKSLEDW